MKTDLKKNRLYFDYNATTPIASPVTDAICDAVKNIWGNPSSAHGLGVRAKETLEAARTKVAALIGAKPAGVFFTSGGTESNNTAILGVARALSPKARHIITSQIEHPSVMSPAIHLMEQGWDVSFVGVDGKGLVDPSDIEKVIRPDTALISLMLANNEVGTIEPISEITRIASRHNVPVHTDAAQAVGKIPVDVSVLGVDYLTIAGHKLYAPKGIGAFFVKEGAPFGQLLFGAGQEMGRRPGTEPVPLAVGLGAACEFAGQGLEDEARRQGRLRERFYEGILGLGRPVVRHGDPANSLPNTLSISFVGLQGAKILEAAPGLMASTGAACHARSVSISHVLSAMGIERDVAMGTLRLSLGRFTSEEDVDGAVSAIGEALRGIKKA